MNCWWFLLIFLSICLYIKFKWYVILYIRGHRGGYVHSLFTLNYMYGRIWMAHGIICILYMLFWIIFVPTKLDDWLFFYSLVSTKISEKDLVLNLFGIIHEIEIVDAFSSFEEKGIGIRLGWNLVKEYATYRKLMKLWSWVAWKDLIKHAKRWFYLICSYTYNLLHLYHIIHI